jgi:hypothetical protein
MVIVAWAVCGCTDKETAPPGDQKDFTPEILIQNGLMQQFAANHPGLAVLKYAQADLDNDGKEDLIVIYRVAVEKNQMCVLRHRGPDVIETNSVPAPVSDQMIQFRNIDEKPPLEFILQGRKGAKVGYAIFRIENDLLTDLFGEGMEDCC